MNLIKKICLLPFTILGLFIGKLSWSAPPWLGFLNDLRKNRGVLFWLGVVVCIAALGGYVYYQRLPKPLMIKGTVIRPGLTPNVKNPVPAALQIAFDYDREGTSSNRIIPENGPSVARIDLVNKKIIKGITINPAIPGVWMWQGDRYLEFKPRQEWAPGVDYQIHTDKTIYSGDVKLKQYDHFFTAHPFDASIDELTFYQDPKDKSIRRVVGTLAFSHPVDKKSLEAHLAMTMRPSDTTIITDPKDYSFSVTYDENQREAYVQSEPIQLPKHPNYMTLTISKGTLSDIKSGIPLSQGMAKQVLIPDIYSFFKVSDVISRIVRNEKQEPEQVIMMNFTDDVEETALKEKLNVYLLPVTNPKRKSKYWSSPREVTRDVLNRSRKVDLTFIPNERSFSKSYNFKYDAPANRFLYVHVDSGLTSVSDFVQASFYDAILNIPDYPKEIKIMGDGALLTYSGQHQLSLLARGLEDVIISVGKVLPGQLFHLISQTGGDIKDPYFSNSRFSKHNISEFSEEILSLNPKHPKTATYASFDLSGYLEKTGHQVGLFFIEVNGWDRHQKRKIYGTSDQRLILISDLGLLVKNNSDASHEIFVQSVATGKPVADASVELLGRNGIALYTEKTDPQGHAHFISTKDFKEEKQPNVYVVRSENDVSFIPFQRAGRRMNYSSFDVGGVGYRTGKKENLTAFIFSDRGIYRPGEEIKLGFIVKNEDLSNVAGIPLEIAVQGPRNNEAKTHKLTLSEKGFFDYSFPTERTSDTGYYNVYLYLIRKNGHRGRMIGSAGFRVEEFQPDTLKIESKLADVENRAWVSAKTLRADITLTNLFGTPAQDRKVEARINVQPTSFWFKEFKDYTFTDPFQDKDKKPLRLEEYLPGTKTDADGHAFFDISLDRFAQGTYRFEFNVEGFEAGGGRSVSARNTIFLSPLDSLVGFKSDGKLDYINQESNRSVAFIAISDQLEQQEKTGLRLVVKEIRHVSTLVKQRNGTYQYETVDRESEKSSHLIDILKEGTVYMLPTAEPGDFAIEINNTSELCLARIPFTVVGHGNLAGRLEKNAELKVVLNSRDYKPGDMIEMNITAPYTGSGLITIESDHVHNYKWFTTTTQSSLQTIQVPEQLEGNAYVNIAFIRDVASTDIFTSPLSYAVVPFTIDRSARVVDIDMNVAQIVRPGSEMEIRYKTSQASKIVVFAVDEGILQVAQYKTPKPLDHFLRKRALGVTTLQILDLILPEFDVVKAISGAGGGMRMAEEMAKAIAQNINPFARKTDAPAVFWSGVLDADAEEKTVSFLVPNTFSGNLRVMAVAVSETAMGSAQTETLVRGPFVISPNVLTQAAPGDRFDVTVGVANLVENSGEDAPIRVVAAPSAHLEVLDENEKTIQINEGDEGKVRFKVKANELLGAADLTFTAILGDEKSRRTATLSVRPAMPYYSSFRSGYEGDGNVELAIGRLLFPDLAEQKASASASPLVLVDGLSAYLEKFPHGCTEQVVSQVFPLIGLLTHPGFEPHSEKTHQMFSLLMDRLRQRQLANGGFMFWPGGQTAAEYPSVYVMHFLIEAENLGYAVPREMIQRGKDFLHYYVGQEAANMEEARVRANAIYLLTRMGEVTTNYLVHLQTFLENKYKKEWKADLTAVYMAATYQLLQKDKDADELIKHYQLGIKQTNTFDDFHSPLTQDAQYAYLLAKHFEDRIMKLDGAKLLNLIEPIFRGEYNTISAAYCILALGEYSKRVLGHDFDEDITITANRVQKAPMRLDTVNAPFVTTEFDTGVTQITIDSRAPVYYLATQSGFDKTLPNEITKQGLEISKAYEDLEGQEVTAFEQGREIVVKLRIRALNNEKINNVAIIDLLPGGFEVIRSSVPRTAYDWKADYVDIREDRVVFYGEVDTSVRELTYRVKLTASGKFTVPPAFAEAMYDRSKHANSMAGSFEVSSSE